MKRILAMALLAFGAAGAAQACPDWRLEAAASYNLSGDQLRKAQGADVIAGGENYIWNCRGINPQSDQGAGYFTSNPDFRFFISDLERYQLVVSVISQCDSALLINTQSASWYYDDDDNGNLDPRIVLTRPISGQIDVWVGTYDGEYCDARLMLETFPR
ncbi:hypothetical protein [Salibaculum griseiflavum]|jgi:hypothetical protein|uniref:Uncharacterized protein n=1 Tax=Salibaculum griseiflavum TaxID=1914409 RepID=A0A2V1P951_9RHOB|nr:hypothetical protein [Salibaculum griseiflavum]PWG18290.1 hypothetical protein DFK10_03310 [Salibaculum griseiflavum]